MGGVKEVPDFPTKLFHDSSHKIKKGEVKERRRGVKQTRRQREGVER